MTYAYPLRRALLGAALVIGVSAAMSWLAPTYIAPELSQRMLGCCSAPWWWCTRTTFPMCWCRVHGRTARRRALMFARFVDLPRIIG